MIPTLISSQGTFEIVRDSISQILANESDSQQALAVAASMSPDPWRYHVLAEHSSPIERYLNLSAPVTSEKTTPVVNVWYETSNFIKNKSNSVGRQFASATFNIDIYTVGVAANQADGHVSGEIVASLRNHELINIIRSIVMSPVYMHLGMRGVVGDRWITDVNVFQPDAGSRPVHSIMASRISLMVEFNENPPTGDETNTLQEVGISLQRMEDGTVLSTFINIDLT